MRIGAAILIAAIAATGCVASNESVTVQLPESQALTVADGFELRVAVRGLQGPTQAAFDGGTRLVLAELNGGENDQSGRVVAIDLDSPTDREVLISNLDKPTGVAIVGDALWVMEKRRLTVGPLNDPGRRVIVADDLPWNGRSEGTLTVTPSGGLLYNTSGGKQGSVVHTGSGTIFHIADASLAGAPYRSEVLATGFKHAYARTYSADGTLFSTEMSDGRFDGTRAVDELVIVEVGDDGGWPHCVGNNRPVVEFGGSQETCAMVRPSHAVFGAGATPTSVTAAPWDPNELIIALWISSQVVTVPVESATGEPWEPQVIIDGIESPQYLLRSGSELLVVDHATGTIFVLLAAV